MSSFFSLISYTNKRIIFLLIIVFVVLIVIFTYNQGNKSYEQQEVLAVNGDGCALSTTTPVKGIFGLNVVGMNVDSLPFIDKLGVLWVRVDLNWAFVEPRPNEFNFVDTDASFVEFAKRGIQLNVILNHAPEWASEMNPEDFAAAYGEFVSKAVSRYKPNGIVANKMKLGSYGVSYWEIFNEPNLPGYGWGNKNDDPQKLFGQYSLMLKQGNIAIHKADTHAVVILGGLSPDGLDPTVFLTELYDNKQGDCFDVIAFHPYGYAGKLNVAKKRLTDVLDKYHTIKPIWFNEIGEINENIAADQLKLVFDERKVVDAVFWFNFVDLGKYTERYGLVNTDLEEKPIFSFFQSLIKRTNADVDKNLK